MRARFCVRFALLLILLLDSPGRCKIIPALFNRVVEGCLCEQVSADPISRGLVFEWMS